ncbi:hypothetical protein HDV05_008812 [Chytridiales sp. JEL 0842]|nr:hypothetical protein HDV05_008812 [Chytridiales sp. JEL 0842]
MMGDPPTSSNPDAAHPSPPRKLGPFFFKSNPSIPNDLKPGDLFYTSRSTHTPSSNSKTFTSSQSQQQTYAQIKRTALGYPGSTVNSPPRLSPKTISPQKTEKEDEWEIRMRLERKRKQEEAERQLDALREEMTRESGEDEKEVEVLGMVGVKKKAKINSFEEEEKLVMDRAEKKEDQVSISMCRNSSRILEGIVFSISGIVNPQRDQIRKEAISLGATYSKDWTDECNVLLCPLADTPKIRQLKGADTLFDDASLAPSSSSGSHTESESDAEKVTISDFKDKILETFMQGVSIFFDDSISTSDRQFLSRYVVGCGGQVTKEYENATLVCSMHKSRCQLKKDVRDAGVVVNPDWIVACWNSRRMEDTERFEIQ